MFHNVDDVKVALHKNGGVNTTMNPFWDVLVIVQYNVIADINTTHWQYNLYVSHFPNVVLFGCWSHDEIAQLTQLGVHAFQSRGRVVTRHGSREKERICGSGYHGVVAYETIYSALLRFSSSAFAGYLYLHHDVVVSPRALGKMPKNQMWLAEKPHWVDCKGEGETELATKCATDWPWFTHDSYGLSAMKVILDEDVDIYNTMQRCTGDVRIWFYTTMDQFYIPRSMVKSFLYFFDVVIGTNLFFEIALGTWAVCFTGVGPYDGLTQNISYIELCTNWDSQSIREDYAKWAPRCPETTQAYHPVKFVGNAAAMEFMKSFMDRESIAGGQ